MLVTFLTGTKTFVVRAIFDNSDEWVGISSSSLEAFAGNVPTQLDARIYVATGQRSDASKRSPLRTRPPTCSTSRVRRLDQNAEIDMMLKLIYAMLALAVLIALLGIANTLALSIYERSGNWVCSVRSA